MSLEIPEVRPRLVSLELAERLGEYRGQASCHPIGVLWRGKRPAD